MAEIEHLTVTLPADVAAVVKGAVESGDYASAGEVVRAALRDWQVKRVQQLDELASLTHDIETGLADAAAQRVETFDRARIIERGRKLLARAPSG